MTLSRFGASARTLAAAVVLLSAPSLALPAAAQTTYPNKPVHIVVGMPAGSFTDLSARWMANELEKTLGATFVVENRPGAREMSRAVLKLAQQACSVSEPMRPWRAVQGLG